LEPLIRIYLAGQVGIECDGRISWFSSAPPEAVAAYCGEPHNGAAQAVTRSDAVVARNLGKVASPRFLGATGFLE